MYLAWWQLSMWNFFSQFTDDNIDNISRFLIKRASRFQKPTYHYRVKHLQNRISSAVMYSYKLISRIVWHFVRSSGIYLILGLISSHFSAEVIVAKPQFDCFTRNTEKVIIVFPNFDVMFDRIQNAYTICIPPPSKTTCVYHI